MAKQHERRLRAVLEERGDFVSHSELQKMIGSETPPIKFRKQLAAWICSLRNNGGCDIKRRGRGDDLSYRLVGFVPPTPGTTAANGRNRLLANANYQRMIKTLSTISGACSCLHKLRVPLLLSVCRDGEVDALAALAGDSIKDLRLFLKTLRGGNDNEVQE